MHYLTSKISSARLTDEEMIHQVFPDQPDQCFAFLYQRYVGKVYQRCLSMTKDSDQAQDFTQDIFIKVFSKLDAFHERSRFSTWLFAVSSNYCADQLRLGKRFVLTSLDEVLDADPADLPADYWHEETLQIVQKAMETLCVQDRDLLRLKYEDGLSVTEIAKVYGLKESTVKMWLKRIREKIQRLTASSFTQR